MTTPPRPEDPYSSLVWAEVVGGDPDISALVYWLAGGGRLHFQFSGLFFPGSDNPQNYVFAGFIATEQPNNSTTVHAATADLPVSWVGDGVCITPGSPPGRVTCTVVLNLDFRPAPLPISLSFAVSDTTSNPAREQHADNLIWFDYQDNGGSPWYGPYWVELDAPEGSPEGEGDWRLTIACWSTQWFQLTRTNVLGGQFLRPVPKMKATNAATRALEEAILRLGRPPGVKREEEFGEVVQASSATAKRRNGQARSGNSGLANLPARRRADRDGTAGNPG